MPRQAVINYPRVAASGRRSVADMHASLYIASSTNAPCRKVSATGISLSFSTISFGLFFNLSSYNSSSYPHLINIGAEDELCVFYDKGSGILNFKSLAISGGAISDYIVARTVPYRVWNSLVINYDGVNFKGYLNGVLVYTKARAGSFTFTNSTVNAGSNAGTASMNGSLSNLFVSQNVLTPDQITDFATRGVIPSNSAVAWALDEGAGQIAYDSSGNGNNGTITSGTWSADVPSRKRGVVGGNMVPNGDMSFVPVVNNDLGAVGDIYLDGSATGSSKNIFGYYVYSYNGTRNAKFDKTTLYKGKPTLKLQTLAAASQIGVATAKTIASPTIQDNGFTQVSPNTSYTFSIAAKTNYVSGDSANGVRVLLVETNAAGSAVVTTIVVPNIKTTTDFTEYSVTVTTNPNTRFMQVSCAVIGTTGAATLIMDAWFADIQLRPTVASGRVS